MTNEMAIQVLDHDQHKGVTVINDGLHYRFGTKQRVMRDYVTRVCRDHQEKWGHPPSTLVYAGPMHAMGALALAHACDQQQMRCVLFLTGETLTERAQEFLQSPWVTLVLCRESFRHTQRRATTYVQQWTRDRVLIPFGMDDQRFADLLQTHIEEDARVMEVLRNPQMRRLWVAVGSGTLMKVLIRICEQISRPPLEFHGVQVGKKCPDEGWSSSHEGTRVILHWAPEKFTENAQVPPPYLSLANYDAKVWRFVTAQEDQGVSDCIWNVAC